MMSVSTNVVRRASWRTAWLPVFCVVSWAASPAAVLASACGGETGWRDVSTESSTRGREMLEALQFDAYVFETAQMFEQQVQLTSGERGIPNDIKVNVAGSSLKFRFSARGRERGSLSMGLRPTFAVFEVDPHRLPRPPTPGDRGPLLFKEWRFTSVARGDGIFRNAVGRNQQLTLVLHGQGYLCTTAQDFHAWSLILHGPLGMAVYYGDFVKRTDR